MPAPPLGSDPAIVSATACMFSTVAQGLLKAPATQTVLGYWNVSVVEVWPAELLTVTATEPICTGSPATGKLACSANAPPAWLLLKKYWWKFDVASTGTVMVAAVVVENANDNWPAL